MAMSKASRRLVLQRLLALVGNKENLKLTIEKLHIELEQREEALKRCITEIEEHCADFGLSEDEVSPPISTIGNYISSVEGTTLI